MAPRSLRQRQQEQTRQELALAAFTLALLRGLANVRVPEIAAAVGVSTRTFNNYFTSKEHAIVWPAAQHAAVMADILLGRPEDEPLGTALVGAVTGVYLPPQDDRLPPHWLRDFRSLVAREPALHGEYLKASQAAERALAAVIAHRMHAEPGDLRVLVIAAMAVGAERAAVMYWMASPATARGPLVQAVRVAVMQAVAGIDGAT